MAGKILMVGKHLVTKKEVVPYRDKKTGAAATFNKVEHQVLREDGVVFVLPDTRKMPGFKMDTYVCPFKPMQDVVIEIENITVDRGTITVAGTVTPLEA